MSKKGCYAFVVSSDFYIRGNKDSGHCYERVISCIFLSIKKLFKDKSR